MRYDGGYDEGFAHPDVLLFGKKRRIAADVLRELTSSKLVARIREAAGRESRWGNATQLYAGAAPAQAATYALDELAGELAAKLLGDGFGTGEYELYGAFTADLKTGDLVRRNDDETYTFLGRKKEVIRRRGENLSPAEVEAALELHPTVAEVAVIGVESDLSEQDVKAFVVPASGSTVDPVELQAHAAERLSRFKVPRWWEVVDELPHTATDRIAKHRLPTGRTDQEVDLG